MSLNYLFNFVSTLASSPVNIKNCQKITGKKDKSGLQFYLLEIAKEPNETLVYKHNNEHYELTDHHISIYESESKSNPQLSQYHYTAYFTNQNKEEFRLHVFFNDNDELTRKAVFSKQQDGEFTPVESKALEANFQQLAITKAKPILSEIRKKHASTVQTLEKQYDELEKQAEELFLQTANETNPEANQELNAHYLKTIAALCNTLQQLIPLGRKNQYQALYNFHSRTLVAIEKQKNEQQITSAIAKKSPEEINNAPETNSKAIIQDTIESSTKKVLDNIKKAEQNKRPAQPPMNAELQRLSAEFDHLQNDNNITPKALEALLADTYAFLITFEEQLNSESIKQLEHLRKNIHAFGGKYLLQLMLSKKLELAAQLTSFHYRLQEIHLNMALQTHDARLLDFLLTNGDFDPNSQSVKVKNKNYPSAVEACVGSNSTDCLAILIKHGASICIEGQSGLPIAYEMLSNTDNALLPALTQYPEQTYESISFYRELICKLNNCLKEKKLTDQDEKSILRAVKAYELRINILQLKTSKAVGLGEKSFFDYDEIENMPAVVQRIRHDPDILKLDYELGKDWIKVKALLKYQNITASINHVKEQEKARSLDEMKKFYTMSYEEIKQEYISKLQEALELVDFINTGSSRRQHKNSRALERLTTAHRAKVEKKTNLSAQNNNNSTETTGKSSFFNQSDKEKSEQSEEQAKLTKSSHR